ncbi:brother of CDO isoform X2 [Ambystoma mexicanum]|uniref:Brother of CDO n=2 Tax=Ambystoma mexicanum TaxID=8296 RepID=A0A248XDV2_AMBME|nr:brother of CDO [Ambystoma mexicanum]
MGGMANGDPVGCFLRQSVAPRRKMLARRRGSLAITWLLLATSGCLADMGDVPRFMVQPLSTFQKYGGSVTLSCAVEPLVASVSWRLDGKELAGEEGALGIRIAGGTLTIAALRNDTVGRYQCIGRMSVGAIASVPAIVTLANLQDFKFNAQHVIEVDEGNTAVIACNLPESHPKAQVRYSVKQEWLESSRDNYLIMPSGNLQIVNATQQDEGTYKCAAYNPVTQEVKTSVSSDRLRVRRSTAEAARIIYPPATQTIIVTKGQNLILECVASGMPPPRITWAKDGADVAGYNKTRFLLSNLLIDATTEADSGSYSCMASNGMGEAGAAFIYYNVQVFEPPEVVMELTQQTVPWGQNVKITCEVRGNPMPSVLWLRNAVPLTTGQHHRLTRKALRVINVGPEDDGMYQCMAENEVGSAQAMMLLRTTRPGATLKPPPDPSLDQSLVPTPLPSLPSAIERIHPKLKTTAMALPPQCASLKEPAALAEAPIILSSPRTFMMDFYELVWKPRHDGGAPLLHYVVKHRKITNSSDDWVVSRIPSSQHRLRLARLDPGSLYEVEMAAYNCAGEGQTAMVTFRTGRRPKPEIIPSKEQIQKDDPATSTQSSNQSDNNRLSPPEAPDRPTISMASETSVYVTWIPRGNGGFPIQSFRVEYKKLKQAADWVLATSDIPPSRLSVEIPELEKGTSYRFRVRALNILGVSHPSAASRPYAVSGYRVYERPVTGPYITFTEAVNETTIMLKWMYVPSSNNNTPIHGFHIYYRPTDSDNDSDYKKDMVEGGRYWHSILHLQAETSYDIKMRCFNEGGESEFSNVVMCETRARKFSGQPGRLPPSLVPSQRPPEKGGSGGFGTGAMVARSSDLPYLIVGVVLGSIVLIIVAFIPCCLWRAWSKQKQSTDVAFPRTGLLTSSCQYTMVPLRGVSAGQANGLPYANGSCPSAELKVPMAKHHPDGAVQSEERNALLQGILDGRADPNAILTGNADASTLLQGILVGNFNPPSSLQGSLMEDGKLQVLRSRLSDVPEIPDDCDHELLQVCDGHLPEAQTPCSPPHGYVAETSVHTDIPRTGETCCVGLPPVEEIERPAPIQANSDELCPYTVEITCVEQDPGKRLARDPTMHSSSEQPTS